jgi:hypothetical protein
MKIAIHQPNFFPWLGYFSKLIASDKFVILDDVQLEKKGGTWCNRVQILAAGNQIWSTAALDRSYSGFRLINESKFLSENKWRDKFFKTISLNYSKHPYFDQNISFIENLIYFQSNSVLDFNLNSIQGLCEILNIQQSKLILSSELNVSTLGTNRLVDIVAALDGDAYLCGAGSQGYIDESCFQMNAIDLIYHNFIHPKYPQYKSKDFKLGLSIIDALMNTGREGVMDLLVN